MEMKTLRIKKVFFEAIERGEKRFEYRSDTPFYSWLETVRMPFMLKLHYQKTGVNLIRKIKLIERIETPEWISDEFVSTDYCWKIHL